MKSIASSVDALLPGFLSAFGPSGREAGIRAAIRRAVRGFGSLREDATGNLILHRPGKGPRLLLSTAMDTAGVIVTRIESSGTGRVTFLGGRSPAELIGATIHFENEGHGLLGYDRGKSSKDGADLEAEQLFLETGLGAKEAARRFPVGSVGAIEDTPARLGDLWCAANLDNRAGCAAVVAALRAAGAVRYDLHVAFTAQSDIGARGAITGAFGIEPEIGIVVDVAHGDSKEASAPALGRGPCLALKEQGYLAHPVALDLAKRAAAAARVKTQWLIREGEGSDARAIRASRGGVPTALLAIPGRRTGGPASLVHSRDVVDMANLVARLLATPLTKPQGGRR